MRLRSEENDLTGAWLVEGDQVIADEVCQRIEILVEGRLQLIGSADGMTSLPAQILGLKDRGMLRENYWADVTVFDPEKVRDRATYTDPHQYAEGAPYVMVNGELVVDGGKITGKLPGKVLTSSDRRQNTKNQP